MRDFIWGIIIVAVYIIALVIITRSLHSIYLEDEDVDGED